MALLSPLLEQLVLSGKAKLKTNVVGKSGQSVLQVAKDRLIIIVEFDYQNFIDYVDPTDQDMILDRSVHQLSFKSKKSKNHFIIRDQLNTLGVNTPTQINNVNGYYRKETFLIHTGNVIVQIVTALPTTGVLSVAGHAPGQLGPEEPPLGYGTATPILQTVNESDALASTQYDPLTVDFTPFTLATPFNVSQLLIPVTAESALKPTFDGPAGQRSYPIVNVTYVELLRSLATKLFSTS